MNRKFSDGFAWGLRLPPAGQDQRPSDCLAIEVTEVRIVNVEVRMGREGEIELRSENFELRKTIDFWGGAIVLLKECARINRAVSIAHLTHYETNHHSSS